MPKPVLFIDDGGVMNDNELRGPQWQQIVGEFFVPILGGTRERWAEANRIVSTRLWDVLPFPATDQVDADYDRFVHAYSLAWLHGMCEKVGVPAPAEKESVDLAHRADAFVTRRVRASYPGAIDAIRALHARGYQLHTSSGEMSGELDGYLEGMGVRECFGRLYGADLVKAQKTGPSYYARIFADAGVIPTRALVVDDKPQVLAWATQFGARTALVGSANGEFGPDLRIGSLAELPDVIESLDKRR